MKIVKILLNNIWGKFLVLNAYIGKKIKPQTSGLGFYCKNLNKKSKKKKGGEPK